MMPGVVWRCPLVGEGGDEECRDGEHRNPVMFLV